jgi:gamma-glutamyltranspeptidase/glutathione hydrolase
MIRSLLLGASLLILTDGFLWSQDAEIDRGQQKGPSHATGKRGVVAAGGKEAVDAGIEAMQKGGNAVDAAVATIFALSVTDAKLFCFGGEVPIVVYDPKRKVVEVLAGQGAAPKLATREYFAKRGGIPRKGIEPAAVPAVLDACLTALDRYGTRTFTDSIEPTLRLLDRHEQPWHADFARTLRWLVHAESNATERRQGLRLVADYFYRGPIANRIDQWCRENGGLLRWTDLATHVTRVEEPVSTTYRGYTVYKCGPWTQGPYLLETLRLLEGFDLAKLGHNRPDAVHLTVEAMKLAVADRDVYYADPLFVPVPIALLLGSEYTSVRRTLIDPQKASLEYRPGEPYTPKAILSRKEWPKGSPSTPNDTTTCVTADADGWMVAATPSGWHGELAGNTGIWLGTRLQSFNTWEHHPNCIEPGKRPRITLTPGLVLKDGKPQIAVSVAGGDGQDQAALQVLMNLIDYNLTPANAVSSPRFGTNHLVGSFGQAPPKLGSLILDGQFDPNTVRDLATRGHKITLQKSTLWAPVVLRVDPATGVLSAAGDPRAKRHAAGY